MKKALSGIIITLAISVAVLCMAVIMAACNDKDDNNKTTDKYTVLVVYEDGTPVNGLTDGTGGVDENGNNDTKLFVQVCSYDPQTGVEGNCLNPIPVGADGKAVFDDSVFTLELEEGYKWHIKISASSMPDGYTFEMQTLDGYKTYTITLKAAN